MSKVYDTMHTVQGENNLESKNFSNCDRVQIDFKTSNVTSANVMGKVHKDAEWVSLTGEVPKTADSEVFVVLEMPLQKIVFTGGDNSQIAYAFNIIGDM